MRGHTAFATLLTALALVIPTHGYAQTTTFHLHNEGSSNLCCLQLKTTGPDIPTVIFQTGDLKGRGAADAAIRWFDTQANVPNWYGTIAAASTIEFRLWMKKTASFGTVFPQATLGG